METLWGPSVSDRGVGARSVVLGLVGGVLVANLLAVAAVAVLAPSMATPKPGGPAGAGQVGLARAGLMRGTPADTVVTRVVATDLRSALGPGWAAGAVTSMPGSPPLAAFCQHPITWGSTGAVVGASRDLTGPGSGARLQVWAFGAGQGVSAERVLRQSLSTCAGSSITEAPGLAGGTGAGFTARITSGRQWLGWSIRRRGDVLVSLTATAFTPAAWLDAATAAVDTRLAALLTGTCASQDEQPAVALTNPYAAGVAYQPHTVPVTLTGPTYAAPAEPAPEVPLQVTLPTPVPHPELAPPRLAPVSQWLDTNQDGVPDTPVPLAQATRGSAPVYADPQLLRIPAGLVTSPPVEPSRPSVPTPLVIQTPAPDPTGPGCGWAFTGQVAPHEDAAALARQAQVDVEQGLVELAAAQAAYQVAVTSWGRLEPAYRTQHASYVAYQTVVRALQDAQAQQSQAQTAYASAVKIYEQALARAAQSAATPAPSSPQPNPSNTTPGPSSTSAPSAAATTVPATPTTSAP